MSGHTELKIPAGRSDLAQQTQTMKTHHLGMRQQSLVIAVVIRRNEKLRALVGRTIAYRMSRQYVHIAGLNMQTAQAYRRINDLYNEGRTKKAASQSGWSDK